MFIYNASVKEKTHRRALMTNITTSTTRVINTTSNSPPVTIAAIISRSGDSAWSINITFVERQCEIVSDMCLVVSHYWVFHNNTFLQ